MTRRYRVIAALAVSALVLSVLTPGAHAGEPRGGSVPIVTEACDPTGDGDKDDCIRHGHHKGSSDHVLHGDDQLVVRAHAHPSLHNKTLRTEVQVRALNAAGKPTGPWTTQGTFVWNTTNDDGSAERTTFRTCAPEKTGLYQVRKKVTVPKAGLGDRSMRSALRSSPTYTSSSTTVASNGANCSMSDDVEELVEYFNEANFNEEFEIQIQPTSPTTTSYLITCPEKDPSIPDYSLVLSAIDGSASSNCNSTTPLTLSTTSTACSNDRCSFTVVYSDSATGMVLSETEIVVTANQSLTYIPNLTPATMPICNNVVNPCLLDGSCSESTAQTGTIQLCDSPTNCSAPLTVTQPGLTSADQVTFVTTTPAVTSKSPSPSPTPSPSVTPTPVPGLPNCERCTNNSDPDPEPTPSPTPSPSSS